MNSNVKIHFPGWDEDENKAISASLTERAADRALESMTAQPVLAEEVRLRSSHPRLARKGRLFLERGGPDDDPWNPAKGKWAIVCLREHAQEVSAALEPLIQRRREAGALFTPGGAAPIPGVLAIDRPDDDNPERWLGAVKAAAANRRLPHHLLLVGAPTHLPFELQLKLDGNRATGRLDVPEREGKIDVTGLAAYAEKVARYETRAARPAPEILLYSFGTDPATKQSHAELMIPLRDRLAGSSHAKDATRTLLFGQDATTARLKEAMSRGQPRLVITASHGIRARSSPGLWGALTDVRFSGEQGQSPFCARDVPPADIPFAPDAVMLSFACFSAGVPRQSAYAFLSRQGNPALVPAPLLAPLPTALLAHPRGPIAFAGHVDYATSGAFTGASQIEAFEDFATWVLSGRGTLGQAMQTFREQTFEAASELAPLLTPVPGVAKVTSQRLTLMWIRYHDAAGYLLLGDPALTIR